MNLYQLSQEENTGYDTYDSAVVCANDREEALRINPGGFRIWDDSKEAWFFVYHDGETRPDHDDTWANSLDSINCQYIGKAAKDVSKGVICASFNAG